jgi:uncharacterized protein YndB with AHSA1/START domain
MSDTEPNDGPRSGVVSAHSDAGGITIVRIFDAPRELVFRAFTRKEDFAQWFGEYESSVPLETFEMDARPGGEWSLIMLHGPDRLELPFSGVFLEVDEPERVVMTIEVPGEVDGERPEVLTAVLRDLGDGRTELTFTQTGGNLPPDEYSRALRGELIFLDRLGEHLASLKARHDQDEERGSDTHR